MAERPIDKWRRRQEFLQGEEALASGADKFTIREQIKEAKQKIAELEATDTQSLKSLDAILLAYSNARLAEWDHAWTNPDDPDRLLHYVPPHYSVINEECHGAKLVGGRTAKRRAAADEDSLPGQTASERVFGSIEEEVLANLLKTSDRLCVSEGPGAGKSIFTRRVLAYLSSESGRDALLQGKPALAVRWEEWDGSWPDDFHASLALQLEPFRGDLGGREAARALAEAALADGRVVLILDALDQVGTEERIRHLSDFLAEARRRGWLVRVVMTGRPFAVEQRRSTLLRDPAWRFACIEDFDAEQQYRYLYGPETTPPPAGKTLEAWRCRELSRMEFQRLVPRAKVTSDDSAAAEVDADDDLDDDLDEELDKDTPEKVLDSLRELFPNYEDVSDLIGNPAVLAMVRGLAEEDDLHEFRRRGDLYIQTSYAMLRRAAERLGEAADSSAIERTEAVLAAVACEMMVHDPNAYRVDGERRVAWLRQQAARRIAGGVTPDEWQRIERVTGLTNRSLLYGASHDVLAWHHKGMMEFYCGLHLARNSQPAWCQEEKDEQGRSWPSCGDGDIRRAAADPQWHWAFRFAIEMEEEVREPEVLLASVSALFQPGNMETGHLRPTQLMHRAWSLLEELPPHEWPDSQVPALLPGGGRIIERFRQQFHGILADPGHAEHDVARSLMSTFVLCPPQEFIAECGDQRDPCTFTMGATDEEAGVDWEKPRHAVRLSLFEMMAAPVTRQQYALFDPNHERNDADELTRFSPEPNCPIINVDWYDAWCFARWLGANFRLPTEAEWEYACRAGGDGQWCFGNDETDLSEYAWFGEDWEKGSTHPVATKRPNVWGLYDMHGNVWEWCADWLDAGYYGESRKDDPTGPDNGSDRVLRGGSWWNSAWLCRSAFRSRSTPAGRNRFLGFRLALVPSSHSSQAERTA